MKYIKSLLLLSLVAVMTGCVSKHYADTGTDRLFSDPVAKIGDGVTPEQAKEMQGRSIQGPKINLFGGNLTFGIFEYTKGLTAQYEAEEFSHGGAAFSRTAASGLKSTVSYRGGKSRGFDVDTIESEAHTKDFFAGLSDLTKSWLEATPAGQALAAKNAFSGNVTKQDINAVLEVEDIPDGVRTELEALRKTVPDGLEDVDESSGDDQS